MANNNHFKVTALAAAIAAAGAVTPAHAFEYVQDDFRMQVDTTVSMGAAWRASDRDYRSVGAYNAAAAYAAGDNPGDHSHPDTSSQDNSNLAWKKGSTYSEIIKATVDVELNYKDYGAFVRGHAYYDHRIVNGDGRTDYPAYYPGSPLDDQNNSIEPNQSDGRSADILDAFVWGNWYLGEMPLNVRAGKQVVSWGEGLFFANGINSANPVDVNALLAPGAELKEALLPVGMVYASLGLTENLSVEAFYQYEWEKTQIPFCGSYFSTSDTVPDNCKAGFFAGGSDPGAVVGGLPASAYNLPRGEFIEPDEENQFGIAFRYYIDTIETEVGFYHMQYDSRTPVAGIRLPDTAAAAGLPAALIGLQRNGNIGALNASIHAQMNQLSPLIPGGWDDTVSYLPTGVSYDPSNPFYLIGGPWSPALTGTESTAELYNEVFVDTFGATSPAAADLAAYFISQGLDNDATAPDASIGEAGGALFWAAAFAQGYGAGFGTQGVLLLPTAELIVEYPEDIRLWGVSFNTNIDFGLPGGATAVSGEISYRENMPMQIEDAEVIKAGIGLPSDLCGKQSCYLTNESGEYIRGYVREEFYQTELSFIHFLDRVLGASRWVVILDLAYNYATIPDKRTILLNSPYQAPLTAENYDVFPDANSWGYRMRFAGEYSNVFAGVNLKPVISFNHDVKGNSPVGTFIEDRKAIGLSLEAEYEHAYTLKVSYTDFYGAEPYNQLADRDFYAISASASF